MPPNWVRPVVRDVRPRVDGGRRPAKATLGEQLQVQADAFIDGHDLLTCELRYRHDSSSRWATSPMMPDYDDRWHGVLPVTQVGRYRFAVRAGVDAFAGWRRDLAAWLEAGEDVTPHLAAGALMFEQHAARAKRAEARVLLEFAETLANAIRGLETEVPAEAASWAGGESPPASSILQDVLFQERLAALMATLADPSACSSSETYDVLAEPAKARFSTWYELFPRSAGHEGSHGTFQDVREQLGYVEQMGFDVLYLPPIHPIGLTARKGREGAISAEAGDPGSPWAIGSDAGGHTAVHPELGTFEDFRALVAAAAERGIDVAIDLAFQASPDHPWVAEHPTWFRQRPDGTIRYAENPPKRYQDIYPFDFESEDWRALWSALLDVVRFWIGAGVRIFRVDNPHTKPFAFWEWLLASVKAETPEVIFLSEAFTRPRVMEHLARIGFTQSYTYFTWRSTKWELESYLSELTTGVTASYLRPNLWPNTPDILTEELQSGGRAAFLTRLVLAATLSSSYGIYGPAFELQEHVARDHGSEEYRRSEKYEIRSWDLESPTTLRDFIALVNRIRRDHRALQFNDSLHFHPTDNESLMCYSKRHHDTAGTDTVLVVVNLDHRYVQSGWVHLDLGELSFEPASPLVAHDLLSDATYVWEGNANFVKLDPADVPCHVFSLTQPASEQVTSLS